MHEYVRSFVRTQWWLRHSNFTLDISISMYFALCILSVAIQHLGRSMGSVPVALWFCFTLTYSHFHWNFHSICRLTSFFSIVYTVHIAYLRIMYTMHDLQYLCTLYSTSCMHICLRMIKIGIERIDAYDAFQFNHTWNVTHDRNIHHVAHFGDSGIQIAANYDRTRFIENKRLSTMKSHLVIMRKTCCWAYELQFNANLNRNIFFFIRDFNF